jgi:hypothetical protein
MAEPDPVSNIVPREVQLVASELDARFTPRELRLIEQKLGRPFSRIAADEDSDEKLIVMAWLKLRRDGYELDFSDMDDVVIVLSAEPDPTSGQPPATSPPSAPTGG